MAAGRFVSPRQTVASAVTGRQVTLTFGAFETRAALTFLVDDPVELMMFAIGATDCYMQAEAGGQLQLRRRGPTFTLDGVRDGWIAVSFTAEFAEVADVLVQAAIRLIRNRHAMRAAPAETSDTSDSLETHLYEGTDDGNQ
jgi:hypothetical protein